MPFLDETGLIQLWQNIQAKLSHKADKTTTINGKALNSNITLGLADLNGDATHRTVTDTEKATWNAKSNFSGNYNDLTNKPTIPSVAGLATETYVDTKVAGLVDSAPGTLDTLNKLAAALGDDPNFATTVATQIGGKVDKVDGKGLSTNDYTTAEKNKLSGIAEGANKTVVDSTLSTSSTNPVQNKVINTALAGKVDVVSGKGLSTNDYTTTEKNKLAGIAEGANKTTVDAALSSTSTNPVQNKIVDTALAGKVDKVTGKGLSTNDYTTAEKNQLATIAADYLTSTEVKGSGAATASVENGVVTINVPVVTADSLGLSSAMLFLGTTTTAIADGSTTSSITVGGKTVAVKAGNVVLYGSKEFVWNGTAWEELGNEGSYKIVQEAVTSPAASGNATAFIDTISQDTNGKITVTKKNVTFPTLSGGSAAANDATIAGGVTVSGHAVTVAKKTIEAGANVTITGGTDKIIIAAKDTTYEAITNERIDEICNATL